MQLKYTPEQLERFWGKVDKQKSNTFYNGTRCWEWSAALFPTGYGAIRIAGKLHYAHRIAYELAYGDISNGLLVLHHCDNPPCCNSSHLFLGTNQDNIDDMVRKRRQPKVNGELNGRHKLSDAQVSEIRSRYAWFGIGGENSSQLSKEFGVDPKHIRDIVKYKSRK